MRPKLRNVDTIEQSRTMARGSHATLYATDFLLTNFISPLVYLLVYLRVSFRRLRTTRTGTTGKNRQNSLFLPPSRNLTATVIPFSPRIVETSARYNQIPRHLNLSENTGTSALACKFPDGILFSYICAKVKYMLAALCENEAVTCIAPLFPDYLWNLFHKRRHVYYGERLWHREPDTSFSFHSVKLKQNNGEF